MNIAAIIVFSVFFTSLVNASYVGEISFDNEELRTHQQMAYRLSKASERCLNSYKNDHEQFYRRNCWRNSRGKKFCLSKYYGDRRYTMRRGSQRSDGKELEFLPDVLRSLGLNPLYAQHMKQISCVGLALNCLEEGFQKTGQNKQWAKIKRFVKANNVSGMALQYALSKIGWRTYYWNPSPYWKIEEFAKRWDHEERNWQSKGYHLYRYNRVINQGRYWFNTVDNSSDLVGFDREQPSILKRFPFWVGTAHTGYHVFPGTQGSVVEAHSTRHITAFDNLEFSPFNPFAPGGGPKWTNTEKYRSGLIVFPPL